MARSILLAASLACSAQGEDTHVTLRPREYPHALKNPLKGFRPRKRDGSHEFGTLCRVYMKWNELERDKSDGVDQIIAASNRMWKDVEKHNIKVIPRVYLHWPKKGKYWPSDMNEDDYSSPQFISRLRAMVAKMGQAWDNDPRVAYVQMGIIGAWGELHGLKDMPEMQKVLAEIFPKAFKNKKVTVTSSKMRKYPHFGSYWDSFAHIQQMKSSVSSIKGMGDRWHHVPIGGEVAYNWGKYRKQPGDDPNDTLRDPKHRNFLLNTIRDLHCNNLGWIAEYDASDPEVRAGAEIIQKAFGYRFILEQFECSKRLSPGKTFTVGFTVRNDGSSPFYANWPVEVSLLDPISRKVIWKSTFKDLDIRTWLPGDDWDARKRVYAKKAKSYPVSGTFRLPGTVQRGEYILALAILDPAGMLPSARFAVTNYFKGGHHPMARVGVGKTIRNAQLDPKTFDDPAKDDSLHYVVEK